MKQGYQIHPMPDALPASLKEAYADVSVATVGHLVWEGALDHRLISPMQTDKRIIGTAVTFRLPTPDTAVLHYATGLLRPGDIAVIDRAGDTRLACLGGSVALAMSVAGAAGAIVDGPVCDLDEIRACDFPVWAQGTSPITTRRVDPPMGSMNTPVSCGGVTIHPGDIILADESGVICLSREKAQELAAQAQTKEATSAKRQAQLHAGEKLGALTGANERVAEYCVEGVVQ